MPKSTTYSALLLPALLTGCGDPVGPVDDRPRYEVTVSGESFVVIVGDPQAAAEFERRLAGDSLGVVNGSLVAGDAGYNAPWSWHLDPSTVEIVDATIELCDGRPSLVEADLDYWLGTVGRFCPWGARITRRLPADVPGG